MNMKSPLERLLLCLLWTALTVGCSDDQATLEPLSPGSVIVAFGNSLTRGTGAAAESSYPSQLAQLSSFAVINAGIPGEVSAEGLRRIETVIQQNKPALVILCHGGNDLLRKLDPGQTEANLRKMIRLIRNSGSQVIMLGVPKPGLWLSSAEYYARIGADLRVPVQTDILPDILSKKDLKADPIHPNARGYRILANSIHAFLKELKAY